MEYKGLQIERGVNSTFRFTSSVGKVIYFDPCKLPAGSPKADAIFVTHEHGDHWSQEDIQCLTKRRETFLIASAALRNEVDEEEYRRLWLLSPWEKIMPEELDHIASVQTVPAYNLNKFRSPGVPFHPQGESKLGFVINIDGVNIYHAGDTDFIPEMEKFPKIDVALLPVGGTYVMTWQEAVQAVKVLKPDLAIPMHYGYLAGTEEDARQFQERVSCKVEIL